MSAILRTGEVAQQRKIQWLSCACYLFTAVLLIPTAWLQHAASLQRWVTLADSEPANILIAEDHLYDYFFPTDIWVNFGTVTAQYSLAALLLMIGMISLTLGVLLQTTVAPKQRILLECSLSAVVVAWFGISSLHVYLSGITGNPSVMQHWGLLGALATIAGAALAILWWGRAPVAALGSCLLMGSTVVGYMIAFVVFAPIFAGYISHDTTPWTESIVAATTAVAALAAILAAVLALRKQRA